MRLPYSNIRKIPRGPQFIHQRYKNHFFYTYALSIPVWPNQVWQTVLTTYS